MAGVMRNYIHGCVEDVCIAGLYEHSTTVSSATSGGRQGSSLLVTRGTHPAFFRAASTHTSSPFLPRAASAVPSSCSVEGALVPNDHPFCLAWTACSPGPFYPHFSCSDSVHCSTLLRLVSALPRPPTVVPVTHSHAYVCTHSRSHKSNRRRMGAH